MKRFWVTLLLVMLAAGGLRSGPAAAAPYPALAAAVQAGLQADGNVHVIVMLRDAPAEADGSAQSVAALHQIQDAVLESLPPSAFTLTHRFDYTPALAGVLTPEGAAALANHPSVAQVILDEPSEAFLNQAVPLVHADRVQNNMGITGEGVTVAVLDTGIDTNHPDLSDDLVAQKCFTHSACPPSNTDESNNAEDGDGHGTNVSGIITSKGVVAPRGFAPDAGIAAVKVLADNGSGYTSDWIEGLEWVYANRETYNISIVNMSLGTTALYTGNCDTANPAPVSILEQLHNAGITVFAASGNNGSSTQISSPACNSHTVAVGAVYDANIGYAGWSNCTDAATFAGKITCFSNSNNQLDILAPGAMTYGPDVGGGADEYGGTSQAAPAAAGVAALMHQFNPSLTPDQVLGNLRSTGVNTTDNRNGLVFPLINAEAAVNASAGLVVTVKGSEWGLLNKGVHFESLPGSPFPKSGEITYEWSGDFGATIAHTISFDEISMVDLQWKTPGEKTVTLKATAGVIQSVDTFQVTIYTPMQPDFNAASRYGLVALFTGVWSTSAGEDLTCSWQYSNGLTHNDCNFSDLDGSIFYKVGLYDVSLTIRNVTGSSTLVRPRYIGVGDFYPIPYPVPLGGQQLHIYPGVDVSIPMTGTNKTSNLIFIPRPVDTVNAPPNRLWHYFAFQMKPVSPLFTRPYTLTIDLEDLDPGRKVPSELSLYSWNPSGLSWDPVDSDIVSDTLTTVISTTHNTTEFWSLIAPIKFIYLPVMKK